MISSYFRTIPSRAIVLFMERWVSESIGGGPEAIASKNLLHKFIERAICRTRLHMRKHSQNQQTAWVDAGSVTSDPEFVAAELQIRSIVNIILFIGVL